MKNHKTVSLSLKLLCITLICAASSFAQSGAYTDIERYWFAVQDAATADASEISNNLTPIVRCNSNLKWEKESDPNSRVLVTTWVTEEVASKYYEGNVNKEMPAGTYIWVTAVPEVKNFCRDNALVGPNLTLRLEQLLGLPPANGKVKFVEFYVSPHDLFRPCPDPEITDSRCELDYPQTGFLTVSFSYVNWFEKLKASSYGPKGYPWTRLGYTYDWKNPANDVGMSEFVIMPGAQVKVEAVTKTADYCK
jgi:hypothetical protein